MKLVSRFVRQEMNLREALVAGKAGGACVTGVLVGESVAFLQLFLDASAPITAAISNPICKQT